MERLPVLVSILVFVAIILLYLAFVQPVEEVLLSFDVEAHNTAEELGFITSTLDQYDAKATFFVTGEFAAAQPGLVRSLAERHEVACHTMTHPRLAELNESALRWELGECKRLVENITGIPVQGFRAPYNLIDERTQALLPEYGYTYDASSFENLGWFSPPARVREVPISTFLLLPMQDYILAHALRLGDFGFFLMRLDKDERVSIDFHPQHVYAHRGAFQYLLGSYAEDGVEFLSNGEA